MTHASPHPNPGGAERDPETPAPRAVAGTCAPGFESVRDEFIRNFELRGELGASVCVIHEGETVVDLWAGIADSVTARPWKQDTIVVVFSCTKAATALCAHILASRGELELDTPVGHYWPQFEQNGKSEITVRMLLNHQAGIPGLSDPLGPGAILDFDAMVSLIERETPVWRPGTRHGYHALTFGWTVGEVVRRITGQTVGSFFRENVAAPLGVDLAIGLPPAEEHRVAAIQMPADAERLSSARFDRAILAAEPAQITMVNSLVEYLTPAGCDSPKAHQAEIPAAGGLANGRALARMFAPLSLEGSLGDIRLVDPDHLVEMGATESAGEDAVMLEPHRYALGFEKSATVRRTHSAADAIVLSEAAFGHAGLGGSCGFADPGTRLAFGYAMNRHAFGPAGELARTQALIDAAYESLGRKQLRSGRWF